MDIKQCKVCKKPFQSYGDKMCADCRKSMDDAFIAVRDFIYDNENVSVDKAADETGVSRIIIMDLLREGRLTLAGPDGEGALSCEMCKAAISTGRICQICKGTLAGGVKAEAPPEPKEEKKSPKPNGKGKMHTRG